MYDTTFLDELASKAPVPGGGGASAYAGALAAALGSMVCNLTVGKKKYADVEEEICAARTRLDHARSLLVSLIEADAEAFTPLANAYGLPKDTPAEQEAKEAALQEALIDACEVPLDIMRALSGVSRDIEIVARCGSRLAVSDAGVAAVFTKAAVQGAAFNVYINIAAMSDTARANQYREETNALMSEVGACCDAIYASVMEEVS